MLAARGLTHIKAAQLLGVHRDTLERWLYMSGAPKVLVERLRTIDTAVPTYAGDFAIPLAKPEMTVADSAIQSPLGEVAESDVNDSWRRFCELTGRG